MVYVCAFEYESTKFLGISFQTNEPVQNPAPGVKCIFAAYFSDDKSKQAEFLEYLNTTFPGNGKNLFNTTINHIEKLVKMLTTSQAAASQAPSQHYMPISGYIVPRPTRNDESEFSRTPISSFSYVNHAIDLPFINKVQEPFTTPKLYQAEQARPQT